MLALSIGHYSAERMSKVGNRVDKFVSFIERSSISIKDMNSSPTASLQQRLAKADRIRQTKQTIINGVSDVKKI